jgi:subtilisin family serine protease
MSCKNCGGESKPGEKFCTLCGAELQESSESVTPAQENQDHSTSTSIPPNTKISSDGLSGQPPGGKKSGGFKKLIAILLGVILLAAAILGGIFYSSQVKNYFNKVKSMVVGSELGKASVKLPAQTDMITTADWGLVPVNQVMVVLKDGLKQKDADQVATALGGKVVGFFEYINLYQIEIASKTEADLKNAIALAKQQASVELAFPNQEVKKDVKLIGVQVSNLDDPVYQGDKGKGYEIVGVQRAWNIIKAAKVKLSDVNVGVVDDGLYKPHGEFDEGADITGDALTDPTKESDPNGDPYGSHGSAVTNIIAANPDNGGIAGIASGPLGKKLHVNMVNKYQPPYGNTWAPAPDPNDPTKVTYSNGHTQVLGSLVAVKKAIDSGSKTVNCSWGNTNAHPETAAAYKRFFEKMAKEHPDVIFVCSAGNDGIVVDGTKRLPSGLNLPNMITVGNVMNDGTNNASSNMASPNYEVTIAAPGQESVHGLNEKGEITNSNGGTSMAAPHVTATIALMRSINPNLTAEQIKNILKSTAGKGVTVGDHSNLAPPELGGGILAVDQAVLAAINELRKSQGLQELSFEDALASTRIDLIAESDPKSIKDWKVTAALPGVIEGGTDAKIELQGGGAIGGSSSKHVDKSGASVDWGVTLEKDTGTVLVTRTDTDSKWKVDLGPDLSGLWTGTAVIERVLESIPYEQLPNSDEQKPMTLEECEGIDIMAILKEMKGKSFGINMTVSERQDPKEPYQASVTFIGVDGKPGDTKPIILGYDSPDVYFEMSEDQFKIRFDGQLKGNEISGQYTLKVSGEQGEIEFFGGSWTVTKQ